jgi:hypothetical protein
MEPWFVVTTMVFKLLADGELCHCQQTEKVLASHVEEYLTIIASLGMLWKFFFHEKAFTCGLHTFPSANLY